MTIFLKRSVRVKKTDFIRSFSSLSNVELLKILEQQENYQPEAIEVAKEILSERSYDQDELRAAQTEISRLLNKQQRQNEKVERVKVRVNEFIDENFGVHQKTSKKLLNFLCAGLFFYTLLSCIFNIRFIAGYYYSTLKSWFFAICVYLLEFLFIYLLYKRSKWGWVLIVGGAIILSLQAMNSLISYYVNKNEFFFIRTNPYTELLSIVINITIVIFLNTKKIREQFTITGESRRITMVVSVILFAFFAVVLKYI
jgi:hypothetical protein